MITFKQFMIEEVSVLYRMLDGVAAKNFAAGKATKVNDKFSSFVKDKKFLSSQFGTTAVSCKVSDLPSSTTVIEIQYDLAWLTQDSLHKELLKRVTGRTEKQLLDQYDNDIDEIEAQLEDYEDEHEVVVIGLKEISPQIFKLV